MRRIFCREKEDAEAVNAARADVDMDANANVNAIVKPQIVAEVAPQPPRRSVASHECAPAPFPGPRCLSSPRGSTGPHIISCEKYITVRGSEGPFLANSKRLFVIDGVRHLIGTRF